MKHFTGNAFGPCAFLICALGLAAGANAQSTAPAADAPIVTAPAPATEAPIVAAPAPAPVPAPAATEPVATPKPEKIAEPARKPRPKPKPKPKPEPETEPAPKPPALFVISVTNARSVALTELDARAGGGDLAIVLGALPPGQAATVKIKRGGDCLYDLHGDYDDGSTTDLSGVDLCKIKSLRLRE